MKVFLHQLRQLLNIVVELACPLSMMPTTFLRGIQTRPSGRSWIDRHSRIENLIVAMNLILLREARNLIASI